MPENNTPKILSSFVVTKFDNGDYDIRDAEMEGVEKKLNEEEIYVEIESMAKLIEQRRVYNTGYRAGWEGAEAYLKKLAEVKNEARENPEE